MNKDEELKELLIDFMTWQQDFDISQFDDIEGQVNLYIESIKDE